MSFKDFKIVCDTSEMSKFVHNTLIQNGYTTDYGECVDPSSYGFFIATMQGKFLGTNSRDDFARHAKPVWSYGKFCNHFNGIDMVAIHIPKTSGFELDKLYHQLKDLGFVALGIWAYPANYLLVDFKNGTCRPTQWTGTINLPLYPLEKVWSNEIGLELNTRRVKPEPETQEEPAQSLTEKMNIIELFLTGEKCQFIHSGEQWHNITGNFKLSALMNKTVRLRVTPKKVNIDGRCLSKDQAIAYIEKHYQ